MKKPQTKNIVKTSAEERVHNVEVSRTRKLVEAIEHYDQLEKHLEFGKHLLELSERGAITPEIISQMRDELYKECMKVLTGKRNT